MRRFLSLIALAAPLALLAAPAKAQYWGGYNSRCSQDYFGNIRCSGSDGSRMRIDTDYFGGATSVYTDGYGRRISCRTTSDYFGNVNTRCF